MYTRHFLVLHSNHLDSDWTENDRIPFQFLDRRCLLSNKKELLELLTAPETSETSLWDERIRTSTSRFWCGCVASKYGLANLVSNPSSMSCTSVSHHVSFSLAISLAWSLLSRGYIKARHFGHEFGLSVRSSWNGLQLISIYLAVNKQRVVTYIIYYFWKFEMFG